MIFKLVSRVSVARSCGCCCDDVVRIQDEDSKVVHDYTTVSLFTGIQEGQRFVWLQGGKPEAIKTQLLDLEL